MFFSLRIANLGTSKEKEKMGDSYTSQMKNCSTALSKRVLFILLFKRFNGFTRLLRLLLFRQCEEGQKVTYLELHTLYAFR